MKPSLALRVAFLLILLATPVSALGAGVLAAGSLASQGGAEHAWVVLPVDDAGRCTVLHLPPRAGLSTGNRAPREGEARIASVLASTPVAAAARGPRLALVFPDSRDGVPSLHGRMVLSLGASAAGQGEWRVIPEKRLEPLPSLRADGLLLGFAGSSAGYAALFQGLASDKDPAQLLLYVLANDRWNEVELPPELQAVASESFQRQGDRPVALATWRLVATEAGLGVVVITRRDASDPIHGAVFLADFGGAPPGAPPSATWARRELLLEARGSIPSDQIEAVGAAGHIVLTTRATDGTLRVYTQAAAAPGLWREVAQVSNIAPDHAIASIESLRRIAVISAPQRAAGREPPQYRIVEVSVGTGAVLHDGNLLIRSPVGVSDYRLIGLLLAYAVGLVLIFVIRTPPREAVHLPPGVSMAEPGRRLIASTIDLLVGVLVACKLLGVPVGEFFGSGLLTPGPGQSVALTALGLLIVANTLLETLLGRSLGKMIAGCAVVVMHSGPAPAAGSDLQAKAPSLWRSLVRNLVKWGLPPVGLLGLLDPGARHRGDLLAGTAVVIETPDEEPEVPDDG